MTRRHQRPVKRRKWTPHLDYTGEPMRPGCFRDPPGPGETDDRCGCPSLATWIVGMGFLLALAAVGVGLLLTAG